MHHVIREQFNHLIQTIPDELQGLILSGTEKVRINAGGYLDLTAVRTVDHLFPVTAVHGPPTAHLGIGGQHGPGMTRKLDFRDNLNPAFLSVLNDFPDLPVRIEAIVVFDSGENTEIGLSPMCTHTGQQRVLFNLDPPPLIIGQMPVHPVHPADLSSVKQPLDIPDGHIVTTDIQHKSAMLKALFCHMVHLFPGSDFRFSLRPGFPVRAETSSALAKALCLFSVRIVHHFSPVYNHSDQYLPVFFPQNK